VGVGELFQWGYYPATPTHMNRAGVVSSDLASIGYDLNSQVLEVEFRTGAVYEYHGVPANTHAALMSAQSHGRYFNQYIKNGGYVCVRIN
jgi:hypothetical protein